MGRKERREREVKRENYATKHSAEKRKQTLIAVGVLSIIAVIVGYSAYQFVSTPGAAQGSGGSGPEGAGIIGSEHSHIALLVKIFDDTYDFASPAYQIKSPWIHFEGNDGTTIHKHATGVPLGYLFESLGIELDDQCYVFPDGKSYCSNEEHELKFFVNREPMPDIREYEAMDDDRVLVLFGGETPEEIEVYLNQLDAQRLIK